MFYFPNIRFHKDGFRIFCYRGTNVAPTSQVLTDIVKIEYLYVAHLQNSKAAGGVLISVHGHVDVTDARSI
jgi:hypothetical protein